MLGGLFKLFGMLVVVFSVVLLAGGLAAAGFGLYDEQGNERGLLSGKDRDRSEQDTARVVAGGVAAGAGLLGVLLGVSLLVVGGWLATRSLRREIMRHPVPPVH